MTEDNEINAKDRQYTLIGLKHGTKYSYTVAAFKLPEDDSSDDLESEGTTVTAKTGVLEMPAFSEDSLVTAVNGKNIQYYWSYKNYQDYEENFSDYVIEIADDAQFTKNKIRVALAKGNYLHKNAIKNISTTNNPQITKYFRIVNKALDVKSNATKKTIIVRKAALPKAPKVVIGEVKDYSVTVNITDLSNNESSFNLYYIDINGSKKLYTTVASKNSKGYW